MEWHGLDALAYANSLQVQLDGSLWPSTFGELNFTILDPRSAISVQPSNAWRFRDTSHQPTAAELALERARNARNDDKGSNDNESSPRPTTMETVQTMTRKSGGGDSATKKSSGGDSSSGNSFATHTPHTSYSFTPKDPKPAPKPNYTTHSSIDTSGWSEKKDEEDDKPVSSGYTMHSSFSFSPPILLDLTGDGISITELNRSDVFVDATGDGLKNRTAWADAGTAVLFYDPDGHNDIVEKRQYVFTEWDPTAASDIDALRSVFDLGGDGLLDAQDAAFANFKLMVTLADGSRVVRTLAEENIVSLDLTAVAYEMCSPRLAA